ncbi:MAG: alpha/beta fold hydrolase [Chloroflexota bacterium]|nr:alpha/beta fold hydrolase [Chloroflexota bacterium]
MGPPLPARPATRPLLMPGTEPFFLPGGATGCLLLHGLSSSPATMRDMGVALAAQGLTVAAPLLAGHGTTPEQLRGKTWPDWLASADAGLAALRAHGCRRLFIAGHSLGGALTLALAARDPLAYAGIILMSAVIWIPPLLRVPLGWVGESLPYLRKGFSDIADPAARARDLTYDRVPVTTALTLIDLLAQVRAGLPRVAAPTLILYARRDHIVPSMNSMYIYSHIAAHEKRLAVLHRSFHGITVDYDREQVWAATAAFIQAHP